MHAFLLGAPILNSTQSTVSEDRVLLNREGGASKAGGSGFEPAKALVRGLAATPTACTSNST
jgi:hypothetical protein